MSRREDEAARSGLSAGDVLLRVAIGGAMIVGAIVAYRKWVQADLDKQAEDVKQLYPSGDTSGGGGSGGGGPDTEPETPVIPPPPRPPLPRAWKRLPLNYLSVSETIQPGEFLVSTNGRYAAVVNHDGQFTLSYVDPATGTRPGVPFWPKEADRPWDLRGADSAFVVLQPGGKFAYVSGTLANPGPLIAGFGGGGSPRDSFFVMMQDDGNMCSYRGSSPDSQAGRAIWCSGSGGQDVSAFVPGRGGGHRSTGRNNHAGGRVASRPNRTCPSMRVKF